MNRPWGFAPEDLGIHVDVWAGHDDQLLDPQWALNSRAESPLPHRI